MKLYATVTSEKGKIEGVGGNEWIEMVLQVGNKYAGRLIFSVVNGENPAPPSLLFINCHSQEVEIPLEGRKLKGEIHMHTAGEKDPANCKTKREYGVCPPWPHG